jgi:hypothetical protein
MVRGSYKSADAGNLNLKRREARLTPSLTRLSRLGYDEPCDYGDRPFNIFPNDGAGHFGLL